MMSMIITNPNRGSDPEKLLQILKSCLKENILSEDLILRTGDEINVPEKKNYITLIGQVVNPGNIIYQPGLKVEDYIQLAGGFSWRALENDVRVVKVNTGEWIDSDDIDQLEPGDTIWILENPRDQNSGMYLLLHFQF